MIPMESIKPLRFRLICLKPTKNAGIALAVNDVDAPPIIGRLAAPAVVTSRLGCEEYDVHGSVDRDEAHQFSLDFTTMDGKFSITPNFYVNDTAPGNRWAGDQMNLTLRFAWHRPDGSTFSSSADPRFDRVAAITLTRITP